MSDSAGGQVRVVAAALGIDADGECLPATFYIEAAIAHAVTRSAPFSLWFRVSFLVLGYGLSLARENPQP